MDLGDKYLHGSLQLIPEQFAVGMKNRGWIPRNHITWHKLNPKPESVSSRFSNDSEPIYFFVKSRKHHFALQYEPYAKSSIERCERFLKNKETFDPARHKHDPADARQAATSITERVAKNLRIPRQVPNGMHIERNCGQGRENYDDRGRRMRSVWPLSVGRYRGAHFATWPPQLVRRIILAGCPLGGTVLDPFLGSGTTIVIAEDLGCIGIGIDLNATYLALARENILGAREKRATATCSGRKR